MSEGNEQEISIKNGQPLIAITYENSDGMTSTSISITVTADTVKEAYNVVNDIVEDTIKKKLSNVGKKSKRK